MSEPSPVYLPPTDKAVAPLLFDFGSGVVRRAHLPARIGAAFVSADGNGLLTLSRSTQFDKLSGKEIARVLAAFRAAAGRAGHPVLLFKELERLSFDFGDGLYWLIRYEVLFGEQGRLFDESKY